MIKESQPNEKQPEGGLPSEDYEKLGRQLLKINPSAARTLFEQVGLSQEEIDKFFVEDAARPEEKNESAGRKVEPETVRAMMEQAGFSEEEIEEFFADRESRK
jgi:hypothetical protein